MSRKRQLPTTEIINAFNGLTDAEKAMVFDYIKSQASTPRPKSSKSAEANPCARCGFDKVSSCHKHKDNPEYHPFEPSSAAQPAKQRSSSTKPSSVAGVVSSEIEKETATAAAGGD